MVGMIHRVAVSLELLYGAASSSRPELCREAWIRPWNLFLKQRIWMLVHLLAARSHFVPFASGGFGVTQHSRQVRPD
jgi:hypothetical protein